MKNNIDQTMLKYAVVRKSTRAGGKFSRFVKTNLNVFAYIITKCSLMVLQQCILK